MLDEKLHEIGKYVSDANTVLKLAVWGICVAITLQVIFYFFFQTVGYNPYLFSITLTVSVAIAIMLIIGWEILKRTTKTL